MTNLARLILFTVDSVIVLALAGLIVRRRWQLSYTFDLYLLMVLILDLPNGFWPARFFHWEYFLAKETVNNILKFAIVLELTALLFIGFPRVRRTVRAASLGVLLGILAAIAVMWRSVDHAALAMYNVQPIILDGTAMLFAIIAGAVLYFRIPVHPVHKAILFGFMPYLIAFTFALDLLGRTGAPIKRVCDFLSVIGYLILVSYWAWAFWRPRRPPPQEPEVLERVQPWLPARGGMW
jgi:hypothetical protein